MTKPVAKDLSHHLSVEGAGRGTSPLKSLFKYFGQPDLAFLGGGLPLSDYFPVHRITADIPTAPFDSGISTAVTDKDKTVIDVVKKADPASTDIELARSLQYGHTEGQKELVAFLKEHTEIIHKPLYLDWELIASVGNTQAWDATLRLFTTRGDSILVEDYSFSSALETAKAQGVVTVPVAMDAEGLLPEALEKQLASWVGPKPKLLYTICTGQNPTGSCLSTERRKKIYAIAQKYDIIIVEDEPYYFLQMEPYTTDKAAREGKHVHDHDEFVKALVPSFLSLDIEGRVIRLDSFSKVLAPGLRLGWIVCQARLAERFVRLHEVSIQAPSGLTQTVTNGILNRWGQKGYLDWLIQLRSEYSHKRDVAIDAINEHFPKDVVSFVPPVAGMFFTVTLDATKHPKYEENDRDALKIQELVFQEGLKQGCLMVPGSWFKSEGQTSPPQPVLPEDPTTKNTFFFRGTYAAVPLDTLKKGLENFGNAIKTEYGL